MMKHNLCEVQYSCKAPPEDFQRERHDRMKTSPYEPVLSHVLDGIRREARNWPRLKKPPEELVNEVVGEVMHVLIMRIPPNMILEYEPVYWTRSGELEARKILIREIHQLTPQRKETDDDD
jgi:hypothetical protein